LSGKAGAAARPIRESAKGDKYDRTPRVKRTHSQALAVSFVVLSSVALAGCSPSQAKRQMMGGASVEGATVLDAGAPPPKEVYVADFTVEPGAIKPAQGLISNATDEVGEMAQERPHLLGGGGILGKRLKPDTPTPEDVANTLAASITSALKEQKLGYPVARIPPGAPLPTSGWVVSGRFVSVDPGNRAERAVVGFGTGEATTEVQVVVNRLGEDGSTPVLEFGTHADSGKMPGAVVTMNPYVAAAKFVLGKQATDRDVKAMGTEIAKQIADFARQRGVAQP
jgi:hypothetical protein